MKGTPQGYFLGPLLFHNFLKWYISFHNSKLWSYADVNNLYSIAKNSIVVKSDFELNFLIMHKWLYENHMMLNPGKCHHMLIENKSHDDKITLNGV